MDLESIAYEPFRHSGACEMSLSEAAQDRPSRSSTCGPGAARSDRHTCAPGERCWRACHIAIRALGWGVAPLRRGDGSVDPDGRAQTCSEPGEVRQTRRMERDIEALVPIVRIPADVPCRMMDVVPDAPVAVHQTANEIDRELARNGDRAERQALASREPNGLQPSVEGDAADGDVPRVGTLATDSASARDAPLEHFKEVDVGGRQGHALPVR